MSFGRTQLLLVSSLSDPLRCHGWLEAGVGSRDGFWFLECLCPKFKPIHYAQGVNLSRVCPVCTAKGKLSR